MLSYIVCYCGRSIGDLYEAFKVMRADLIKQQGVNDIKPNQLPITTELDQVSVNPIFEQLSITQNCCKKSMMCVAEFHVISH